MIKLLATDLDGTLFYPKHRIRGLSSDNKKFLLSLLDFNTDIILASGRNNGMHKRLEQHLKREVYFLGCNGGYYIDKKDKLTHNRIPLDPNLTAKLYLTINQNFSVLCWFLLDDSDNLYCIFNEDVPQYIRTSFKLINKTNGFYREKFIIDESAFLKQMQKDNNYKIMPVFAFGNNAIKKATQVYLSIKDQFNDNFTLCIAEGPIEITSKGVSKGNGLLNFCKDHEIDKNDVIVVGNSYNDISMFELFPHSFCMSNAEDEVKKHANHVIDYVYQIGDYLKNERLMALDTLKTKNL